jgi:tetratricopeptide (TPR) repeat protein
MRVGAQVGIVTAVVFFLTAVAPLESWGQADPKKEQAKQLFESGKWLYEMQDWQGALEQFKQAAAILASPVLHFNIAVCYEKLGRPRPALKYYERYLQQLPKAENRAEVEARMAALQAQIDAVPAPAPGPGRAAALRPAPAPAPVPTPARTPGEPGHADEVHAPQAGEMAPGREGENEPGSKPTPTTRQVLKPMFHQWWPWVVLVVGVALAVGITYLSIYASKGHAASLDFTGVGWRPGGLNARPLSHRPLLLPPPSPAGVLFRF